MKLFQLIEYNRIFFRSHAEYEAEGLAADYFLFFKKVLYEVKAATLSPE